MKPIDEQKRRIVLAKSRLSKAQCTCGPNPDPGGPGHDMFWLECDRTKAEVELDEALAAIGIDP